MNPARAVHATMLVLLVAAAPPAAAASAQLIPLAPSFPDAMDSMAAASNGTHVHVFGGRLDTETFSDRIYVLDPARNQMTTATVRLPSPAYGIAAAYADGRYVLSGGYGCALADGSGRSFCREILTYDPATNELTETGRFLPNGFYYQAAAAVGDHVYVFGGANLDSQTRAIHRYTPATNTFTTLDVRLPQSLSRLAAVALGDRVYLLGGQTSNTQSSDAIHEFDPPAGTVTTLTATLAEPVRAMPGAGLDGAAYLFGGRGRGDSTAHIVAFSAEPRAAGRADVDLPNRRVHAAAAATDTHAFVFGGLDEESRAEDPNARYRDVLRFTPGDDDGPGPGGPTTGTAGGDGDGAPGPGVLLAAAALMAALLLRGRPRAHYLYKPAPDSPRR